jgi:hypothetical protein
VLRRRVVRLWLRLRLVFRLRIVGLGMIRLRLRLVFRLRIVGLGMIRLRLRLVFRLGIIGLGMVRLWLRLRVVRLWLRLRIVGLGLGMVRLRLRFVVVRLWLWLGVVRLGLMVSYHRLGMYGFFRRASGIIWDQHPVAAILSFIIAVFDIFPSFDHWGTYSTRSQSQECEGG